jgi:hypothetical protein
LDISRDAARLRSFGLPPKTSHHISMAHTLSRLKVIVAKLPIYQLSCISAKSFPNPTSILAKRAFFARLDTYIDTIK